MFYYSNSNELAKAVAVLLKRIMCDGVFPVGFNVSLITAIPKKGEMKEPADYRPISVSNVLATVFEYYLLSKMTFIFQAHDNQFGFQVGSSCKQAYYAASETIEYYKNNGSNVYVASLDLAKAFDKLWREGLYYKLLKQNLEPGILRALINYYNCSLIAVKNENQVSRMARSMEGVKQGGILSPYLFNYFMNEMIIKCCSEQIGCRIGSINVCVIAYCDDILLICSSKAHLQKLVDICSAYVNEWKMVINVKKSNLIVFGNVHKHHIFINGEVLPQTERIMYLGMPLDSNGYYDDFIENRYSRVEKCFYALNALGCKIEQLSPYTVARLYKCYCLPILNYGLDNLKVSRACIKRLESRQGTLIKYAMGIGKRSHHTALITALDIEPIGKLCNRIKVCLAKHLSKRTITKRLMAALNKDECCPMNSIRYQLGDIFLEYNKRENDGIDSLLTEIKKKNDKIISHENYNKISVLLGEINYLSVGNRVNKENLKKLWILKNEIKELCRAIY